ncbi:hypothetical protein [Pedobacter ginsenosidimutans]|nr:hypothetical protein [Pedobacter ginsenosidimutans]
MGTTASFNYFDVPNFDGFSGRDAEISNLTKRVIEDGRCFALS